VSARAAHGRRPADARHFRARERARIQSGLNNPYPGGGLERQHPHATCKITRTSAPKPPGSVEPSTSVPSTSRC
jgi:hypothetical protein